MIEILRDIGAIVGGLVVLGLVVFAAMFMLGLASDLAERLVDRIFGRGGRR